MKLYSILLFSFLLSLAHSQIDSSKIFIAIDCGSNIPYDTKEGWYYRAVIPPLYINSFFKG